MQTAPHACIAIPLLQVKQEPNGILKIGLKGLGRRVWAEAFGPKFLTLTVVIGTKFVKQVLQKAEEAVHWAVPSHWDPTPSL